MSVAAVTIEDNRLLTIRRADTGALQIPGGVLELNETVHAGLVREVREETGVVVEPQRLTGDYKHMSLGVIALVFRCRAVAGTARPSEESTHTEWLDMSTVQARMEPTFAVRVLDALSDELTQPAVRAHDGKAMLD